MPVKSEAIAGIGRQATTAAQTRKQDEETRGTVVGIIFL